MTTRKLTSSIMTIFTMVNTMIGSAMLVFPVLFKQEGIITGLIILTISALICYKTCEIYIMHTGSGDNDVEDTVRRIMGLKWEKVFRLITGVFLVLVSVVYVVLICDEIYDIIYYIMHTSGASDSIADKDVDHLVFNKFSKQYLSFILFGPLLAITFLKNLDVILKLAAYGVASVFVYFAFLLYQFFTSVAHGIDGSQIKWFDFNAGELTGTAAMAFTTHTVAVTIMKSNENQNNNIRDLRISYLVGLLLYGAIGTFGSLAIWNKKCEQTIVNCYLQDFSSVIVAVSYFYGLITVYPCLIQVGRTRLLQYFYPQLTSIHLRNFNISFMVFSSLMVFLGPYIGLDTIMNLIGSIICYLIVYYIPSMLHMHCFYKQKQGDNGSLLGTETTIQTEQKQQCGHAWNYKQRFSYKFRRIFYISLNVIGVAIGIYGIYLVFA